MREGDKVHAQICQLGARNGKGRILKASYDAQGEIEKTGRGRCSSSRGQKNEIVVPGGVQKGAETRTGKRKIASLTATAKEERKKDKN